MKINKRNKKRILRALYTIDYCFDESADLHREEAEEFKSDVFKLSELNDADALLTIMQNMIKAKLK